MRALAALLGMSAALALAACAAEPVQRSSYEAPRRSEDRRPLPGQEPRILPMHDEWSRMRKAEAR